MDSCMFDDLLTRLGTGKWNMVFFIIGGFSMFYMPPNVLSGAFVAPQVDHTCRPPAHAHLITTSTHEADGTNATTTDSCYYYVNGTEGGVLQEPCDAWDYDNSTFSNTLTSQFDLVCSSKYLRATYMSMYMFGNAIGSVISGILCDRFGRKAMLILGVIIYFTMTIGITWLSSFLVILVFRFVAGLMHANVNQGAFVLAMEVCVPKQRSTLGIILAFPWAVSTIIWGGLAYLLRDWRWLNLTSNLTAVLFFPCLWFMDESPRWLVVNGHFERARKVLEKAARWNNVNLPPAQELDHLMTTIQKESTKAKKAVREEQDGLAIYKQMVWKCILGMLTLLRTPKLRSITLVTCFTYFMVSMTFYGMSLNATNYSADPFIYMALTGLMEVPSYTLMAPIVGRLGRKWPVIVCFLVCGIVIVADVIIPSGLQWLAITLAMVGKMCITAAYQALFLYSTELFPTEVRLQGFGSNNFAAKIGSMTSPFITEMLGPLYSSAPSLVFGIGAILAGLATLLLHETLGTSLPDTIAVLENTHQHHTPGSDNGEKRQSDAKSPA